MEKKNKTKKIVAIALPLVSATLALASCNSNNTSSSSSSSSSSSASSSTGNASSSSSSSASSVSSSSSSTSSSVAPVVNSVVINASGSAEVSKKQSLQLSATVDGTVEDKSVSWSVNSEKVTISSTGLLEVKDVQFEDSVVVVTATSNADSSVSASLSVVIKTSTIVIEKSLSSVEIKDRDVEDYDFTSLFVLTVDDENVKVTKDMIDSSDVKAEEGYYTVLCSYGNKNSFLTIHVSKTVYAVESAVESVTLKVKEVAGYDFKALFSASRDGENVEISDEMVESTVEAKVGTYKYVVTLGDAKKEVSVEVVEDHVIEAFKCYQTKTITLSEVEGFDATSLFTLTVDGTPKKVTANMIDVSGLNKEVGKYIVTLKYSEDSSSVEVKADVEVVADHEVVINAKNLTIYPGSERIDVLSLFSLTIDGVNHDELLSASYVSGYVDYSSLGTNEITYSYAGKTATSVVTIATGAHLEAKKSNTIIIKKGTSKDEYQFANDVLLISNGLSYSVANKYIDTSKVDFSKAGTYEVVVTVPYTQGETKEQVTLTLTYVVRDITFSIVINQEVISGNKDLSDNEILSAITVTVNGIKQSLYTDKDQVTNNLTTYVEIDKSKVDFSKAGTYSITLKVYVDGKESTNPEEIILSVNVVSNVALSLNEEVNNFVFEGGLLDETSFFSIKEDGEEVAVTKDMVEGKVDVFTPGSYTLTLTYKGEIIEKTVFVVSKDFLGTYKTNMRGITTTDSSDDSEDVTSSTSSVNKTFVFDGNLNDEVKSITAIDENTLLIRYNGGDFYFTQEDGIAYLVPVNKLKMQYTATNRQYIFAKTDVYTVLGKLTFNTSSTYVVDNSSACTSIDVLILRNAAGEKVYYGLVTELAEKTSMDYYYRHSYGEVSFEEGFDLTVGSKGTVTCGTYSMYVVMEDAVTGKRTDKAVETKKYTGTYTGTIDGKASTVEVSTGNGIVIKVDGKEVADLSIANINNLKFGGYNYETDSVFVYDSNNFTFAYNIHFDTVNNTFTVDEKDGFQGLFVNGDVKVFLDGYGTGIFQATSSYATAVQLKYTYKNGLIEVEFVDTKPSFKYGSRLSIFMDSYKNNIVIADSDCETFVKMELESKNVIQGAKVQVSDYSINMLPLEEDAIDELVSKFTITTADGLLTNVEDYLDYSLVDFSKSGFYLVSLTLDINGSPVTKYYTFEVLSPIYENNPVVGEYKNTNTSSYTLSIDSFGTATLKYSTSYTYTGKVTIDANYGISATLTKVGGTATIELTGSMKVAGALAIKISGDRSHSETLYADTNASFAGVSYKTILRSFTRNGETSYLLCSSESDPGEIAEVSFLNDKTSLEVGAIIDITTASKHLIVRVEKLNNAYSGLSLAGDERGEFALSGQSSLVLDGFGLSSSSKGVATIGETSYDYYLLFTGSNVVALCNKGTSTIASYALINKDANTYSMLEENFSATKFGKVTYSSVTTSNTSDHYFEIDNYGVGYYYYSSSKYIGYVSSVDEDGNMVFTGSYVTYSSTKYLTVTLTKLDEHVYKTSVVTVSGSSTSSPVVSFIIPTTATRESYLGYDNANYITHFTYGNDDIFLYYATSSSNPEACKVTVTNGLKYTDKGALIHVTSLDGTKVIIENAMITKVSANTRLGYLPASNTAGTYTVGSEAFTIDGFANIKANTEGKFTLGSEEGTYSMYSDNTIKVTIGNAVRAFTLNSDHTAVEISSASYQGQLRSSFTWLANSQASHTFEVDSFGFIKVVLGNSTYIGVLPANYVDGDDLTLSLTELGNAYSSSPKSIKVSILNDDVIVINESSSSSYYYVKAGASGKVYANVSSSANIIYEVTKGESKFYLYAPKDGEVVSSIASLVKENDSAVELGTVGAIFSINYGSEKVVVKLTSANKITLAKMEERKTFTSTDGSLLFIDGFTTSETSRGNATLGGETYTYYLNPFYENVITLYEGNDVAYYVSYSSDKFELISASIDQSKFAAGTYKSANNPTSTSNVIIIDEYGFGKINGATGRFVVDSTDETGSTLIFTGKTNVNYSFKTTTIKVIGDGIYALSGENKGYYFNGSTATMAGKSWHDLVFEVVNYKGEKIYVLAKSNSYSVSDLVGVVTVTGDFGVENGIFTVQVPEGTTLYDGKSTSFTAKYIKANGYSGYEYGDGFDGTYTNGSSTIKLNGFGTAVVDGVEGTYELSGSNLTVVINGASKSYTIDSANKTFTVISGGETSGDVLANTTYVGKYSAVDWDYYDEYDATVTMKFGNNGDVTISFSCPSYSGYAKPEYVGTGTYEVDGSDVIISVGTATLMLSINNDGTLSVSDTAYEDEYAFGNFARGEIDFDKQ